MDLLIAVPGFPPQWGGVETLALGLARELATRHLVRVVTLDHDEAGREEWGFSVERVPGLALGDPGSIRRLNRAILGSALRRRPDVLINMHVVTALAAVAVRNALRVPGVQYFHAKEFGRHPRLVKVGARLDAAIAVSGYTAELCRLSGMKPAHVSVIPPGIDPPADFGHLQRVSGRILTVSRMEDGYKGHDMILRALREVFAENPDAHWVCVGEGREREGLASLARALGLADRVSFVGRVDAQTLEELYATANVFLLPSRVPPGGAGGEGFGIVCVEAAARGVPVVAGRAGGLLDAVADGSSGLLVDPHDSRAIATSVSRILQESVLAARLSAGGVEHSKRFAWDAQVARVEKVISAVARGRSVG